MEPTQKNERIVVEPLANDALATAFWGT